MMISPRIPKELAPPNQFRLKVVDDSGELKVKCRDSLSLIHLHMGQAANIDKFFIKVASNGMRLDLNMDFKTFELIKKFLYTGILKCDGGFSTLSQISSFADEYDSMELKTQVEINYANAMKNYSIVDIIDTYWISIKHSLRKLEAKCLMIIIR